MCVCEVGSSLPLGLGVSRTLRAHFEWALSLASHVLKARPDEKSGPWPLVVVAEAEGLISANAAAECGNIGVNGVVGGEAAMGELFLNLIPCPTPSAKEEKEGGGGEKE